MDEDGFLLINTEVCESLPKTKDQLFNQDKNKRYGSEIISSKLINKLNFNKPRAESHHEERAMSVLSSVIQKNSVYDQPPSDVV